MTDITVTTNDVEQVEDEVEDEYFTSYEDLEVHQIMLTDKRRNLAYKKAIEKYRESFFQKKVLDVGAGTGFLSVLCAQAGAKLVHAVEASKGMIPLLKKTVRDNENGHVISVHEGPVEHLKIPREVDIIVSEWMGFYLLHEGMLSSVIHARDHYLKPDGLMLPEKSRIKASLCRIPSLFDFWNDVDGVNLSHVGKLHRRKYETEPAVMVVEESDVISSELTLAEFDLNHVTNEELATVSKDLIFVPKKTCEAQGICLSFEVSMFDDVFSTGPSEEPTHWKQSVIVFPDGVEVEEGEAVAYRITLNRTSNPRRYAIELVELEADDVEHEVGCECSMAKCRIICAYLKEEER